MQRRSCIRGIVESLKSHVRKWILLSEKLSTENDFLKKKVSMLEGQVDAKLMELDEQSKKVEKLEEELKDARKTLEQLIATLKN